MDRHHAGTKLARTKSGDRLLHEVRQQQQQQQCIDAYEEMEIDLRVRAPPPAAVVLTHSTAATSYPGSTRARCSRRRI